MVRSYPKFAIDHPGVYELFGLPKEVEKAYARYRELESKANDLMTEVDRSVIAALVNQGVTKTDAEGLVRESKRQGTTQEFEPLFRTALNLRKGGP